MHKKIKILAIETSCDETSVAIVENGQKVLALATNSQIPIHTKYGGVVPELASRMHTENILYVYQAALKKAHLTLEQIDAIAVTYGPGLTGSLLVGIEFAKTLSFLIQKPLIAVNHLIGHVYANQIEGELKFPLLGLIVSGGHTMMFLMTKDYHFKLLGQTLDDALGESYDKVAKILNLAYPGGPNLEKKAVQGKDTYSLPIPVKDNSYHFSYSGLKSAVLNIVKQAKQTGVPIRVNDLACSFQTKAIAEVCYKVNLALQKNSVNQLVVAGGVAANKYLRQELKKICHQFQVELQIPPIKYCTDNAAMIGAAAYPLYLKQKWASYRLNSNCSLGLF